MLRAMKVREYYLRPREMFARAYAQYIALRSGDEVMLDQILRRKADFPGTQWDDADFGPVAKAFDELFTARRWRAAPEE